MPRPEAVPNEITLDAVAIGERVAVVDVRSVDAERRRMLDLGILPGTKIDVVNRSPLGDPTAYRVRGAVVALRREQARLIRVEALPKEVAP